MNYNPQDKDIFKYKALDLFLHGPEHLIQTSPNVFANSPLSSSIEKSPNKNKSNSPFKKSKTHVNEETSQKHVEAEIAKQK